MKAGLVVGTAGQLAERAFLSNSAPTALAQEFYDLLATTVPLRDFPYDRAGLTSTTNTDTTFERNTGERRNHLPRLDDAQQQPRRRPVP